MLRKADEPADEGNQAFKLTTKADEAAVGCWERMKLT
jgi:hypothetical protein